MAIDDNINFTQLYKYYYFKSDNTQRNITLLEFCDGIFDKIRSMGGYPIVGFQLSYTGPFWMSDLDGYGWARGFAFIQNYNYDYNEIGELFYFTHNILNVGFIKTDENKLPVFSRYTVNMSKK